MSTSFPTRNAMSESFALPVQRPAVALLVSEPFRAAMELVGQRVGKTRHQATGDGHPVVIFPGLGANGAAVATLRNHCRSLGYEAFDWGQGFNTGPQGDLDGWLANLKTQVTDMLGANPKPATLIGWSLGGLYARELGKLMAPRLRQVITVGTPFNADADHTHAGWLFRLLSGTRAAMAPSLGLRLRTPPPVRTTSIYSKSDGVVAWQTCRHDKPYRRVRDIEVDSSHMGMTWNREVLSTVSDLLAQPNTARRRNASPA